MAVINRADAALPARRFDLLVVGAGVLGLLAALELRRLRPEWSLLVAERGGVPSEEGATFVSPGLTLRRLPAEVAPAAAWLRDRLTRLAEWAPRAAGAVHPVGAVQFGSDARSFGNAHAAGSGWSDPPECERLPAGAWLERHPPAFADAVRALLAVAPDEPLLWDPLAGWASAEALAFGFGHAAVGAGAHLLLNARLAPLGGSEFEVARLAYERDMERRVVRRERIAADRVLLACGAASAELAEAALGRLLPLPRAYRQYPRVEADRRLPLAAGRVQLPLLGADGLWLRPQGEGLLLVPPPLPPDPPGYEPTGGRLLGVPVGVRRDLLEALLERQARWKVLAWESLNLGKTVARVRGAWQVAAPRPRAEALGDGWWLLTGGELGLLADLAAAVEVAHLLVDRPPPWEDH